MATIRIIAAIAAALALLASAASARPALDKPDPAVQKRLEEALTRQDAMVAADIARLAPQRPGVRDVYFIGVAGWGDQDVFRLETRAVRKLFEDSFDADGRAL